MYTYSRAGERLCRALEFHQSINQSIMNAQTDDEKFKYIMYTYVGLT